MSVKKLNGIIWFGNKVSSVSPEAIRHLHAYTAFSVVCSIVTLLPLSSLVLELVPSFVMSLFSSVVPSFTSSTHTLSLFHVDLSRAAYSLTLPKLSIQVTQPSQNRDGGGGGMSSQSAHAIQVVENNIHARYNNIDKLLNLGDLSRNLNVKLDFNNSRVVTSLFQMLQRKCGDVCDHAGDLRTLYSS